MKTNQLAVFCTCPDESTADMIAKTLVEEELAACVNRVGGIRSFYRWQGKIQADEEYLLIIKTRASLVHELTRRVESLHPYELPEVIAVPITAGSTAYLAWIDKNTRAEAG